jgi:hypothetical protein
MDPEAWRRACVEFRAKLSRDTGVDLGAAVCENMLGKTCVCEGEFLSLQSDPGLFYACLGDSIANNDNDSPTPLLPKVAWFCYREAAEVHTHPGGMRRVAECYYTGQGVTENPVQAVAWFLKAADLGDRVAQATLGTFCMTGFAPGGVEKDAARAVDLLSRAAEQGESKAVFPLATFYLTGEGVEEDAVHGVALLWQSIEEDDEFAALAKATLADCYMKGVGVEADTVQAALWCQRAADGGSEHAMAVLPLIRTCTFCGTTPARKHCERCRKVRYCSTSCQAAHWNRETDPQKGHCRRRAAEASQQEAGGASTSAQTQ